MHRLVSHDVPVSVRLNIQTQFTGDHVQGENVLAEIPGTDPALKDQVVMLGGHLDSWIAGTGATDDGAGTIIALEAMRILRALDLQPRRTIRAALWEARSKASSAPAATSAATMPLARIPPNRKSKSSQSSCDSKLAGSP